MNIDEKKIDGTIVISNITKGTKIDVERVHCVIEPNLLHPLLRSRDVKKWHANSSVWIILPHTPKTSWQAIPENELRTNYQNTYQYLERFEKVLRNRSAYKLLRKGHPFYILVDIHTETFAPYKVVWTRFANIQASVIKQKFGKPIIPQETITLVALHSDKEAYYLCLLINSSPFQLTCISYSQAGGKSMGSPHILDNICISKFNLSNYVHLSLSNLSEQCHEKVAAGIDVTDLEDQIDKLAAELWGLTKGELQDIKESLEELK